MLAGFLNKKVDLYSEFAKSYNSLGYDFNINIARLWVCSFLIWKLLSRNFELYGFIPDDVFVFYPVEVYSSDSYIWWTGTSIITDIFTMHWVHWFVDRPGPEVINLIQNLSITSLFCLAIFGRGPKRVFVWSTYLTLIYLWGNLFLLGQEIDSVAMYFGILLVLAFCDYKDEPIWRIRSIASAEKNVMAGRTISCLYLILVTYYFSSGLTKLTDISLSEWIKYDLIWVIERYLLVSEITSAHVPSVFENLLFIDDWGNYLPPLVYLSHLFVPVVFFDRSKVLWFFLFYAMFHFMTFGVSISFTGYIVIWGCLFHYREWFVRGAVK